MLNYSKEQYDKDRKKMGHQDKTILDEKFKAWEKISKKCNVSHIINAPKALKIQTSKNRVLESELAAEIKKIVQGSKKKTLDQNEN